MRRIRFVLTLMLAMTSPLLVPALHSQSGARGAVEGPLLRELFTGLHGDLITLEQAREGIDAVVAREPDNVEALAWRGAATLMWSSLSPDLSVAERITLFQQATGDMNRAVELQPDNPRVRLPRGVVLRLLTPGMPRFSNVPGLVDNARVDYQRIFDLRKGDLDRLSEHQAGELLEGLGDLYSRQDKVDEAERYYRLLQSRLPGTEYAARAAEWLKTRMPLPADPGRCLGCHVGD